MSRRLGRLVVASVATVATTASLLIAAPGLAGAAPLNLASSCVAPPSQPPQPGSPPPNPGQAPPRPTQQQIGAATASQLAAAQTLGAASGRLAGAQQRLQSASAAQELAEQKAALALSQYQKAVAGVATAKRQLQAAQDKLDAAHAKFVQYIQESYMSGGIGDGMAGLLLSSPDPNALLEQSSLEQYQAEHKADAVGVMQVATVSMSNAEAGTRRAAAAAKAAKQKADAAQREAAAKYQQAQTAKVAAQAEVVQDQASVDAAQQQVARLNGQSAAYNLFAQARNAYNTYTNEKTAYQHWVNERAAYKNCRAAEKRAAQHHGGSGGGGGSSSGGGSSNTPPPSSAGGWTAAKGRRAAQRAIDLIGTIYIWAGGNRYGPTDGGCSDPVSPCGTVGYDCSGLVLYAWAANWDHFAATQYWQAGSFHPSPGQFKKGDLLFWTGGESEISHVAVYIGNGDVVQAPESGEYVKITPWDQVEPGYAGATRPLT